MSFTFLIASERSGSNLLTALMNGHSKISGPPPSHLFRLFGLNAATYLPTTHDENWNDFLSDFVDACECMIGDWDSQIDRDTLVRWCSNRRISEAFDCRYAAERRPGETVSFVKENHTYLIVPFLLANWPDATFVHLVRDPRDVAASWQRAASVKGGVERAVQTWVEDQTRTLGVAGQLETAGRLIRVRYEDLIQRPRAELTAVCSHVGVEFERDMLAFHRDGRTRRNARRVKDWANLERPILADNSGTYRDTLSDDGVRYVELLAWPYMRTFGYDLETDADSLPADQARSAIEVAQTALPPVDDRDAPPAAERTFRSQRDAVIARIVSRSTSR